MQTVEGPAEKKLRELVEDYHEYRIKYPRIDSKIYDESGKEFIDISRAIMHNKNSFRVCSYSKLIRSVIKNINKELEKYVKIGIMTYIDNYLDFDVETDKIANDALIKDLRHVRDIEVTNHVKETILKHINAINIISRDASDDDKKMLLSYYYTKKIGDTYCDNNSKLRNLLHNKNIITGIYETNIIWTPNDFDGINNKIVVLENGPFLELIEQIDAL